MSPCKSRLRSVSIRSPSNGSSTACVRVAAPARSLPLRDFDAVVEEVEEARGVGGGLGVVLGEERNADNAVIWPSVKSDTFDAVGICSRASNLGVRECESP